MHAYDVIIPARNEALTIAAVVAAARSSRAGRVLVIDDHSTDGTAAIAAAAGAEVVTSRGKGSKALALATGVAHTTSDVLVFFDADISGVTPQHFDRLAAPVLERGFAMSCGMLDYGWRSRLYLRLPPITGLRAVRRDVFNGIPESKLNGFQIEIMINEVVARGSMPSAITVLRGTAHRTKLAKLGLVRGMRAHLSMTAELLHCLTFVPLWTYRSYLSNLTILGSD
ncbi:MAG TPA: glycosyltransferase [Thermoanaerobaculia bacterium]|jgi:glycosyltransferase involved in cell wall biosynthesis